jgi:hypothetical protein
MNIILNILNIILSIGAVILGLVTILFADSPTNGAKQIQSGILLFLIPIINILSIFIGKFLPISKTNLHITIFIISIVIIIIYFKS